MDFGQFNVSNIGQYSQIQETTLRDENGYVINTQYHVVAYDSLPVQSTLLMRGTEFGRKIKRDSSIKSNDKTPEIHTPSFRSLSGLIVTLILSLNVISLFICLDRTDICIVFYIAGYFVWCINSEVAYDANSMLLHYQHRGRFPWKSRQICTKKTYKSIETYTLCLILAIIIDAPLIIFKFGSLLYENHEINTKLGPHYSWWKITPQQFRMLLRSRQLTFVAWASLINFVLKGVVIGLSYYWLSAQRVLLRLTQISGQN